MRGRCTGTAKAMRAQAHCPVLQAHHRNNLGRRVVRSLRCIARHVQVQLVYSMAASLFDPVKTGSEFVTFDVFSLGLASEASTSWQSSAMFLNVAPGTLQLPSRTNDENCGPVVHES